MKNLFTFLVLFFGLTLCHGQVKHIAPFELNEEDLLFIDSIYIDSSLKKEDFFVRSKLWIATVFENPDQAEVFADKEKGLIVAKGTIKIDPSIMEALTSTMHLSFSLNIYCKDGRSRIVIERLSYFLRGDVNTTEFPFERYYFKKSNPNKGERANVRKSDKLKWSKTCKNIILDFIKSIQTGIESSEYSDF